MRIVLHFLFKGRVARELSKIGHDELNASSGQSLGVKVFRGSVHARDIVYVHVLANELVLDQSLEIAEQPLVSQVQ